jgi:hypothetical protein
MNHMVSKAIRKGVVLGLMVAAAPLAAAYGQEAAAPEAVPARTSLAQATEDIYALITDQTPLSEYWIGIALGELPEVAKKQLKLEHGLVVDDVLPDSPAAKAEFKQHDVLVRADDKPLNEPADILKAVNEAKDKEMRIVIVRDGKQATLKVTPIKRPKPEATESRADGDASELRRLSIKKIEEALEELKGKAGNQPLGIYFARPAVVAGNDAGPVGVPNNLTVRVTKERGAGPAKIHVKRDDKEWEVTEDKLDDLPSDLRAVIQRMLGKGPMTVRSPVRVQIAPQAAPRTVRVAPAIPTPPVAPPQVAMHAYRVTRSDGLEAKVDLILKKLDSLENKSLEQLQEEVKRLRKELDELRSK